MAKKSPPFHALLFGLLVIFCGTYCDGRIACEPGWDYFKEKCYHSYQFHLYTYHEARTVCIALGGTLAKINNLEEDLWLKGYTEGKFHLWLGANDIEQAGVWKWEDGSPITYSNWYTNQPDNRDRNPDIAVCLHFYNEWNGKWNDASCSQRKGFICEKDINAGDSLCGAVPVGIESGEIPDSQMTASSVHHSVHMSHQGRLNYVGPGSHAWCARLNTVGQWLQINLGRERTITKVATQGRNDAEQWVKTFYLAYNDGQDWKYVQDDGHSRRIFEGNSDKNTIVYHDLVTDAFTTQYVRFYPLTWQGHMSMRVELYACT